MFPFNKSNRANDSSSRQAVRFPKNGSGPALILVMGLCRTGKSSFINLARSAQFLVADGVQPCTAEVQITKPFILDNRSVILADTPGFDGTTKSDLDILTLIANHLTNLSPAEVQGVVYLHCITDNRMDGVARRNLKMFQKLCGTASYRNVAIVTTRWDEVDLQIGIAREEEFKSKSTLFKLVLDGGASLFRHTRTKDSAHAILRRLLKYPSVELLIQKEIVIEQMGIPDAAAGLELRKEILKLEKQHKEELRALHEELEEAMREHEMEVVADLKKEVQMLREQIAISNMEEQKLSSPLLASPLPRTGRGNFHQIYFHAEERSQQIFYPRGEQLQIQATSSRKKINNRGFRSGTMLGTSSSDSSRINTRDEPHETGLELGKDNVALFFIFVVALMHFYLSTSETLLILLFAYTIYCYVFTYYILQNDISD